MFLKYFIAGMIFATVISPILEYVVSLACAALETVKGKLALKVAEYNYQITKLEETEEPAKNQIGFTIPEEEDDYDEDED